MNIHFGFGSVVSDQTIYSFCCIPVVCGDDTSNKNSVHLMVNQYTEAKKNWGKNSDSKWTRDMINFDSDHSINVIFLVMAFAHYQTNIFVLLPVLRTHTYTLWRVFRKKGKPILCFSSRIVQNKVSRFVHDVIGYTCSTFLQR